MWFFNKRNKHEYASITDFALIENLDFRADKPIFFNIDNQVRYSENGIFDTSAKVIWLDESKFENRIKVCFVSPNSEFLVVYQNKQLFLLNNKGDVLEVIKSVADYPISGKLYPYSVQWAKNSEYFYLLYYDYYTDDFNKRSKNKTSLYRYSIKGKKLEWFISFNSEVNRFHYYLSKDNRSIFFRQLHSRCFYRIQLDEHKAYDIRIMEVIGDANSLYFYKMDTGENNLSEVENIENEFDNLFINFINRNTFQHGDCFAQSYDLSSIIYCDEGGLYSSKKYQIQKVFNIQTNQENINVKQAPDINLFDAYFLPTNRHFIFHPNSKEYKGYLILDTHTTQYAKLPYNKLDCYFSITTDDCSQLRWEMDFEIKPKWDDSKFHGFRMEQSDGKYTLIELPLPQPNLRDALKAYKKI